MNKLNQLRNLSLQMSSKSFVMIPKDAIESYKSSENATISMNDCHYISIMGKVVKDEIIEGVEYETIYANEISDFEFDLVFEELQNRKLLESALQQLGNDCSVQYRTTAEGDKYLEKQTPESNIQPIFETLKNPPFVLDCRFSEKG